MTKDPKFKVGDVVALTGRTRGRDIAKRKVIRVMARYVELNCGARFSPCGSFEYPRARVNTYGLFPNITHWTEAHSRELSELADAEAVRRLREDMATCKATRAQVAKAREALGLLAPEGGQHGQ